MSLGVQFSRIISPDICIRCGEKTTLWIPGREEWDKKPSLLAN